MRRIGAAMFAGAGALLAAFASCSDGGGVSANLDGGEDAKTIDAKKQDYYVEPADTGPQVNTEGWLRIDYPGCAFFSPPTPDKLPPPLVWEPCPSIVEPLGIDCKHPKRTWQPPAGVEDVALLAGSVDGAGKARLAIAYAVGPWTLRLVVDADGPVHQANSSSRAGDCTLSRASVAGGKVIWTVVRPGSKTSSEERGAIGGDIDAAPLALEHWDDGAGRGYYAGPLSYFVLGPDEAVRPWMPGAPALGNIVVTDPGQMFPYGFVSDELFYEVSNLSYARIKVYSPSKGSRDFVSFGNDVSKNAVDFGTDGIDMVWVEAFGRADEGAPWTTINIMTSKFTTDAGAIQKRRVRSEGAASGLQPFTVGCGYAAHYVSTLAEGNILRIVRLSDGRSWKLPEIFADGGFWFFEGAKAITCEEIFMRVRTTNGLEDTVRVRLDSLGPGEPAD